MPKQQIVIPIIHTYPFNNPQYLNSPNAKIYVKKTLDYGIQSRFAMKQKIRMLKNLGFQNLIGLQSTYQQEKQVNLIFQYVPFELKTKINSLTSEAVSAIKGNMYELAENLSAHCIEHEFQIQNIGLDKKNSLKYYLGFNFKIDRTMKKEDTLQRYKRIIQYFFAHGGPLIKSKSPNKSNQFYQTVDTSCKLSHSEQSIHQLIPTSNLMKKSSTVPENTIAKLMSSQANQILTRYTFNCNNPTIPEEERKNYDEENTTETKGVKMQELGARINKLKSYMKQITGKTPKSTSGLSKLTVKIDSNNSDNRIFQQNKIMITPSYTQLQKKISQFRQSKLYRAYNQREILYSKNNQGYQLHSTHKLQNNQEPRNDKPQTKYIQYQACQTQPIANKVKTQQERSTRVPEYLLKKKESNASNKNSPKSQNNKPPINHENSYNSSKSSALESVQSHNISSSKNMRIEDPQQKEYRTMAEKDKYCQQFMFFLEADQEPQINYSNNSPSPPNTQSQEAQTLKPNGEGNPKQIQQRVNKAIRNSIKLISGLKSKEQSQ